MKFPDPLQIAYLFCLKYSRAATTVPNPRTSFEILHPTIVTVFRSATALELEDVLMLPNPATSQLLTEKIDKEAITDGIASNKIYDMSINIRNESENKWCLVTLNNMFSRNEPLEYFTKLLYLFDVVLRVAFSRQQISGCDYSV